MTDRVVGDPGVQRAAGALVATIRRQPDQWRQHIAELFRAGAEDDGNWDGDDEYRRCLRTILANVGDLLAEVSAEEARVLAALTTSGPHQLPGESPTEGA